jgi:hypothetical protein
LQSYFADRICRANVEADNISADGFDIKVITKKNMQIFANNTLIQDYDMERYQVVVNYSHVVRLRKNSRHSSRHHAAQWSIGV